mmetsp:Transcript_34952/g.71466  ORF Transcript_34952/g.71466 Transcript_34952/m.71466 type:complete len:96 (+) Transcript_34952:322-609(+)
MFYPQDAAAYLKTAQSFYLVLFVILSLALYYTQGLAYSLAASEYFIPSVLKESQGLALSTPSLTHCVTIFFSPSITGQPLCSVKPESIFMVSGSI